MKRFKMTQSPGFESKRGDLNRISPAMPSMELFKLQDAAHTLSISYQTLKRWIYQGKIQSVRTPGGHHRIPQTELRRLAGSSARRASSKPHKSEGVPLDAISGRNKLLGTVSAVRFHGLLAEVKIDVGGQSITSIITRGACQALGLRKGMRAFALIKATEVMIIRG
jgi:molybdopterin-binding protein